MTDTPEPTSFEGISDEDLEQRKRDLDAEVHALREEMLAIVEEQEARAKAAMQARIDASGQVLGEAALELGGIESEERVELGDETGG